MKSRTEAANLITYQDQPIPATPGQRLLDALLEAGIDHRHICGGFGFCTSCRVEVLSGADGLSPISALERTRLGPRAGGLRLACQCRVVGRVSVRVPRPQSSLYSPDGS